MPELTNLQVLRGIDPDGTPILSPPATPVLLKHVLTHLAGFSYGFSDEPVDQGFRAARDVQGAGAAEAAPESRS